MQFEEAPKIRYDNVAQSNKKLSVIVFSSPKALMKFFHIYAHAPSNESPTTIVRT